MATLTGNSVASSYPGLIKFDDNGAVQPTTLKALSDGTGGSLPLSLSQVETKFTSGTIVDFTGVTVNGLPADTDTTYDLASAQDGANVDITLTGSDATVDTVQLTAGTNITLTEAAGSITIDAAGGGGAAGLVLGSFGVGSMASAAALTTTAAIADSDGNIALGNNAQATGGGGFTRGNIAIGLNTVSSSEKDISIGVGAQATGSRGVCLGENARTGFQAVAIGNNAKAPNGISIRIGTGGANTGNESISIGHNPTNVNQNKAVSIGYQTVQSALHGINIGSNARASGSWSVGIGLDVEALGEQATAIGPRANVGAQQLSTAVGYDATTSAESACAIGDRSRATLIGSVALGTQVTSLWAQATTVNQMAYANYANIDFTDDTAAATGGVPLGGVYHTAGSLKIRVA